MATTITFPNSYLSTNSQPWGRVVEKQLTDIKLMVTSNEINNSARDNQLANSLARVNVALANAQTAITNAQTAITGVQNIIDNIYVTGTETIDGAVVAAASLNGSTLVNGTIPGTKLQAHTITANEIATNYIYAGTITAGQITAGTLTGFTINTAASGTRVELGGTYATDLKFYDSSDTITGSIRANSTVFELSNTYSGNGVWGTGSYSKISLNQSNMNFTVRNGSFTGGMTLDFNLLTTPNISAPNVSATASVSAPTITSDSFATTDAGFTASTIQITSSNIYNATTSQAYNVHIQGSANGYRLYRSTFTSTRDLKRDIRPLSFDKDAYINISPVVFKYVDGVLREEEKDWDIVGFIAEDFIDAGLGEHLVTQPQDEDDHISLRYDKMYMFLHSVVKSQQETIKDLITRLEILENK